MTFIIRIKRNIINHFFHFLLALIKNEVALSSWLFSFRARLCGTLKFGCILFGALGMIRGYFSFRKFAFGRGKYNKFFGTSLDVACNYKKSELLAGF